MDGEQKITLKYGYTHMNFDEVTGMLSTAFWSIGIGKAEVIQGAMHSALLIGAFLESGRQIGYARVISDKTRFAYILDVIVDKDYRRKGIGQNMIRAILESDELKDVYQWLLITKDAHEVYKKAGFTITGRPEDWMEIRKTRPMR
jgi:ribosomal protein S18 acetylase RimI-like enzyme